MPAPATHWQAPVPTLFACPDLRPTHNFRAPTRMLMRCPRPGETPQQRVARIAREAAARARILVASLRGEPFVLRRPNPGLPTALIKHAYDQQLAQLTPERNGFVVEPTQLRAAYFRLHEWLRVQGLYAQGWRARQVSSHPDDGKPYVWMSMKTPA